MDDNFNFYDNSQYINNSQNITISVPSDQIGDVIAGILSRGKTNQVPTPKPQKNVESYAYLCKKEKQEEILTLLNSYLQGKIEPNDIMMPFRAAMDAGTIRKPTFREFTHDFDIKIAKSTFDDYLRTDKQPFEHIAAFREMVEAFKKIIKEEI